MMLIDEKLTNWGHIEMRIEEILRKKNISKSQICKDMDIPRPNFNRYCRNDFQRIDTGLICKLCWYLDVDIGELIVYRKPEE